MKGVWATDSLLSFNADPGGGIATLLAGDFIVSRGGEVGRLAGDPKSVALSSGRSNMAAFTATVAISGSISIGAISDFLDGGLIGLFANGFSKDNSSSESYCERVNCVIFLGLSGFLPPA